MNRLRDRLGDLSRYADRLPPMAFDFDFDPAQGPRWRLGITVSELGEQLAAYFGARDGGVLVAAVREGSPAARAGLTAGDVITSVDGTPVRSRSELVRGLRDGDAVTLGIVRDRKATTVKIEPRGQAAAAVKQPARAR
ncbi:MAG: S1C family serine protease [Betaproteobacteria bacterium]